MVRMGATRKRHVPRHSIPSIPVPPFERPKFGALQHANVQWLTDADPARRDIIANYYDLVMCGLYNGLANVPARMDYMRGINPDLQISQYMQILEGRCKGIFQIELVSGTTYRVILDGTGEGASTNSAYGSNGNTAQIRNCVNNSFNGNWTMSNVGQTGGRPSFTITGVPGGPHATEAASTGSVITTNEAHAARVLIIQNNGGPKGWWLRKTSGGVANRIPSSGVDATQRAVNITSCVEWTGTDYYPHLKADYDFANLITPYQPTVGDPLICWIDNWNYRPRQSAVYGTVDDTEPSGAEIAITDSALQTRFRNAMKTYAQELRSLMPGVKIIGNADGVAGAAPAGIQSLNWPEWPVGTLDGSFIEDLYGPNSDGTEDLNTIGSFYNDNWAKLQGRLREQRARLADPGLHVVHVRGRGANNAAQQADYQFFIVGLVATMMQGTSRANMSHYAFGPILHDVTVDFVLHDAMVLALLGEPIDGEQTAARGWAGAANAWARTFEGGVIIGNSSTTTAQTITLAHLATLGHGPSQVYKRMNGPANPQGQSDPFNDGTNIVGSFSIPAKSGVILLKV